MLLLKRNQRLAQAAMSRSMRGSPRGFWMRGLEGRKQEVALQGALVQGVGCAPGRLSPPLQRQRRLPSLCF